MTDRVENFNLAPGSPVARAKGCICKPHDTGTEIYKADMACPLHGVDVVAEMIEQGDVNLRFENDDDPSD